MKKLSQHDRDTRKCSQKFHSARIHGLKDRMRKYAFIMFCLYFSASSDDACAHCEDFYKDQCP